MGIIYPGAQGAENSPHQMRGFACPCLIQPAAVGISARFPQCRPRRLCQCGTGRARKLDQILASDLSLIISYHYIYQDQDKKSKFASILDAIERVTGFDLDGDGTVAGDIVCEVLSLPSHCSIPPTSPSKYVQSQLRRLATCSLRSRKYKH